MASENIKLIPENQELNPEFKQANTKLQLSERIYFLGFGFDATNMKKLGIGNLDDAKQIYGTSFGLSQQEIREIHVRSNKRIISERMRNTDVLSFLRDSPLVQYE